MKLYVALTYLQRKEWAKGTVWAVLKGVFELGLRKCLRDDGDDTVPAHASLYFEGSTERMRRLNETAIKKTGEYNSFCIDILENDSHAISSLESRNSWYRRWEWARIEFYEVVGVTEDGIERAHSAVLSYLQSDEPYDCFRNVNALFPCFPFECRTACCPCCCCCPYYVWRGGVTCVSASLIGLAAARGVPNPTTASPNVIYEALGIPQRTMLGGRLPSEAVEHLVDANQVNHTPAVRVFRNVVDRQEVLPLITVR